MARVKSIFEQWQLAQHLDTARESAPFDPDDYADDTEVTIEDIEDGRQEDVRRSANDLLLIEQAKALLLDQ